MTDTSENAYLRERLDRLERRTTSLNRIVGLMVGITLGMWAWRMWTRDNSVWDWAAIAVFAAYFLWEVRRWYLDLGKE